MISIAPTQTKNLMPPEWAPHTQTWMAFPTANDTFGAPASETLHRARTAWAKVASVISNYEPVKLVVDPADKGAVGQYVPTDSQISLFLAPLNDAWMRDAGPTFVINSEGSLSTINWIFNGWGAQEWARWDKDSLLASSVAKATGTPVINSPLVTEGGGFHIDGQGTVLLTETVQLDPDRNPNWDKTAVTDEINRQLGTTHAIWLPRGLTRDYDGFGTRGHVDIVACFTESGDVLIHRQDNSEHPDYEVSRELRRVLEASEDAHGNRLTIIDIPAPYQVRDDEGWVDYSYINHYVCNGAVILCAFGDDEADNRAKELLSQAYPNRTIELIDARDIFAFGGGIHCITQQQPAVRDA
ncbi:agmatine deiminase family protein [Corynebacterium phoceense]|uniref:agmatine deiminase family protein n=1 Tax=Corynebacterium phoceense TaxID=1686286 RepID=UPI00211C5288|nr:agmatine deiminase family protein [Corynebacterium phoceense]MCQ9331776.1 agmatine deiminase family protein [Corynebacterium phoceense]